MQPQWRICCPCRAPRSTQPSQWCTDTSKTRKQNKWFLFLCWLTHAFCYSNTKLTQKTVGLELCPCLEHVDRIVELMCWKNLRKELAGIGKTRLRMLSERNRRWFYWAEKTLTDRNRGGEVCADGVSERNEDSARNDYVLTLWHHSKREKKESKKWLHCAHTWDSVESRDSRW